MKKYAILLLAGSIIGFSSCGDDSNTTTQEQIDSAANARAAAIEAELTAKNDSLINAMAMMKADSAARADSLARTSSTSTTTTRTTTTTTKSTKPATTKTSSSTTKDGRLDIDKDISKQDDGRVNLDKKTTKESEKKQDKEGRLKID